MDSRHGEDAHEIKGFVAPLRKGVRFWRIKRVVYREDPGEGLTKIGEFERNPKSKSVLWGHSGIGWFSDEHGAAGAIVVKFFQPRHPGRIKRKEAEK